MVSQGNKISLFFLMISSMFQLYGRSMITDNVYIVIMAGGNGTRLWPLSREANPKQCLALPDETLLEQAVGRAALLVDRDHILISTTKQHERKISELVGNKVDSIIVEPGSRNTGPAILLACMEIHAKDPNAIIVFVPSDPFIPTRDWPKFTSFLEHAIDHAHKHDDIVLLGVEPIYPATGYGYIEYDLQQAAQQDAPYKVTRFREKPSQEVAQQYLEQGNKLWNISIFCAQASTFVREFQQEAPEMFAGVKNYIEKKDTYEHVIADSIDYALIERSKHVSVMPVDFSWCDVGNIEVFLSLKQQYNTLDANFIGVDSRNNLVDVPGKLVALVGVDDLCVVEVDDALLITKRDKAENVRGIVRLLKQGRYKQHL